MVFNKIIKSKDIFENNLDFGQSLFLIGIFFLPSAFPIGAIFLLISIIISFINNKENLFKDKWNFVFLVCILIIFVSTLFNSLFNFFPINLKIEESTIWLNLFNWIPIYLAYLGFQTYLKSSRQRLLFQKILISGSFPVIISCVMHKFLNIYGPFKTLFGTIVWFNYESIIDGNGGVTGLFNNPNYLGMWLTICLPFSISILKLEKGNTNRIILFAFNLLIIYFALSTNSRNAFLGIFISLILFFGIKRIIYFCLLIVVGFFLFDYLVPNLININESYLYSKFSDFDPNLNYPRIHIWGNAINLISQKPLLGWGGGTLPYITMFFPPFQNYQHTHNLIIELSYNFGIPLSLLILSSMVGISIQAFGKVKELNKSLNEYTISIAFLVSFCVFLIAQLTDITYYDGKISIIFSAILAGLNNIIQEKKELNNNSQISI